MRFNIPTNLRWWKRKWKTIKTWIPIILKDDQYDHMWLYRILKIKFQLMEKFYREEAFRADADKIADTLKDAWKLCERLENEPYFDEVPTEMQKNTLEHFREEGELMEFDLRKLLTIMKKAGDWWD